MSNERDELADVIGTVTDNWDEPLDPVHDIPQIVNAILAAGYRKPSTVTTAAELDALPAGSIVLEAEGCPAQKFQRGWLVIVAEDDGSAWLSDYMETIELPAEILLRENDR